LGHFRSIHINQLIDNIPITCIDKPSGNFEAHHIETVGGTFNGQNWRMKTAEVMDRIAAGTRFVVNGADGSQARVEVRKHFTSAAKSHRAISCYSLPMTPRQTTLLSLQPSCLQIERLVGLPAFGPFPPSVGTMRAECACLLSCRHVRVSFKPIGVPSGE
jgi:hypothetical protein